MARPRVRTAANVLFAPVSGPVGSGEYYRCLNIARALHRRRPELSMHFLLSRRAEVEQEPAFEYHLLDGSPTRAMAPVLALIERLRPRLALFDCAGRMRQFRAVKAAGGHLVWLSNRPKKRRKGFRPGMLRLLDLHLIVEPGNPAPALGRWERWLLDRFGAGRVEFCSAIAPEPEAGALAQWRESLDLSGDYVVFASGGGGYHHDGRPVPEIFLEAAVRFHEDAGREAVVIMGPQYRGAVDTHPQVSVVRTLPTRALGQLLAGARLAVTGAGNMLSSQALAAEIPCTLVAVGGRDQPARVARYEREGIALAAALDPESMSRQAIRIDRDPDLAHRLVAGARAAGIRNDVVRMAEMLSELLGTRPSTHPISP
jgi:UDP:flavonoid glycosyltransferase YjiC (YdhE family)